MTERLDILFDEDTIHAKVAELAARITADYAGRDLVLVGVLKGAAVFLSDLARLIALPVTVDYVRASSYGMSTTSSGRVAVSRDAGTDVRGKDVLLVDTIVDTGETLARLYGMFEEKGPASVRAVVLLDKRSRRTADVPLAYVGFELPDEFVVGYGVDRAERYRNLPYIAVVRSADE